MFKKETKVAVEKTTAAEKEAGPSIEQLAQAVRDNETRVEAQRKDITSKEWHLIDLLHKPKAEQGRKGNVDSFDLEKIEHTAAEAESEERLVAKLFACDDALHQPSCCDRDFLNSLRDYLVAIRPRVVDLENEQWECLGRIQQLRQEIQQYNNEYDAALRQIAELLRVAHIFPLWQWHDKRFPMNGACGIGGALPIVKLIDDAIADSEDGKKYAINRNFDVPATPLDHKYLRV